MEKGFQNLARHLNILLCHLFDLAHRVNQAQMLSMPRPAKRSAEQAGIIDLTSDSDEESHDKHDSDSIVDIDDIVSDHEDVKDIEYVDLSSDTENTSISSLEAQQEAEIENLADAHVDLYPGLDPTMRPLFKNLIKDIIRTGNGSTFSELADWEAPSNSLDTNVLYFLHWPPKQPGLTACGTIVENRVSPSIRWMRRVFPEFDKSTAIDLVSKRMLLYDPITGQRQEVHKLYAQEDTFEAALEFAETVVRSLQCTTDQGNIFAFGNHVKSWFKEVFGDEDTVQIQGCTVSQALNDICSLISSSSSGMCTTFSIRNVFKDSLAHTNEPKQPEGFSRLVKSTPCQSTLIISRV